MWRLVSYSLKLPKFGVKGWHLVRRHVGDMWAPREILVLSLYCSMVKEAKNCRAHGSVPEDIINKAKNKNKRKIN